MVPVVAVTLACCLLAIRWAEDQFNRESVLFRESERLELRRWLGAPGARSAGHAALAEAFFCVAIIYRGAVLHAIGAVGQVPANPDFSFLALLMFISQVVCIALPALLMTMILTRRPLKTLLLDRMPQLAGVRAPRCCSR